MGILSIVIQFKQCLLFLYYRSVHEPGSLSSQARLKPLLRQIVEDIVDNSRPDLVDISHKSAGFGDLLKSGFGLVLMACH